MKLKKKELLIVLVVIIVAVPILQNLVVKKQSEASRLLLFFPPTMTVGGPAIFVVEAVNDDRQIDTGRDDLINISVSTSGVVVGTSGVSQALWSQTAKVRLAEGKASFMVVVERRGTFIISANWIEGRSLLESDAHFLWY